MRAKPNGVILVTLFLNFEHVIHVNLMFVIVDFDHDFASLLSPSQDDQFFFSINELNLVLFTEWNWNNKLWTYSMLF